MREQREGRGGGEHDAERVEARFEPCAPTSTASVSANATAVTTTSLSRGECAIRRARIDAFVTPTTLPSNEGNQPARVRSRPGEGSASPRGRTPKFLLGAFRRRSRTPTVAS